MFFLLFFLLIGFNVQAQSLLHEVQVETTPGGSSAHLSFKVEFEAPPDKVFKILTDTNSFEPRRVGYNLARVVQESDFKTIVFNKILLPEELEKIILKKKWPSDLARIPDQIYKDYVYYRFAFPWPLKDRYAIHEATVDETKSADGIYTYAYQMRIGNFKTMSGQWQLTRLGQNTLFSGFYNSDAGTPLPSFLVKKIMLKSFNQDMNQVKKDFSGIEKQ